MQAGIAADAPAHGCCVQAGFGALGDQRALELGDGTKHLQGEHALWRRGVNRIVQATKWMPMAGLAIRKHRLQNANIWL